MRRRVFAHRSRLPCREAQKYRNGHVRQWGRVRSTARVRVENASTFPGLRASRGDEKNKSRPPLTIRVHRCTDAGISLEKSQLVPPSGLPGVGSMRCIGIHKSFPHWEIEGDTYRTRPARIAVARVPRKVSQWLRPMFTMSGSRLGEWRAAGGQLSVASCRLPVVSEEWPVRSGERVANSCQLPVVSEEWPVARRSPGLELIEVQPFELCGAWR
jgi:hypothetical protein